MLEELLREIRNYFVTDVYVGTFRVSNGSIDVDFLKPGQYFKIHKSIFNDGVYQYPVSRLTDETFAGEVWAMAVPPAVIALAEDIAAWNEKNSAAVESPYTSESFGGYSYTLKSSVSGTDGGASSSPLWAAVFGGKLRQWRKIRYESPNRGNVHMHNA